MTQAKPIDISTKEGFDPESVRMSVGDHLEELRSRILRGLIGFVIAIAICFAFSERVITIFCRPLIKVLRHHDLNTLLFYNGVGDIFMVYIKMTLISAAVVAAPWIVYQLWQFVAAGLYPRERRYITKYLPLSLGLLASGVAMLYFLVLPISLEFFITFSSHLPLKLIDTPPVYVSNDDPGNIARIPLLQGDPQNAAEGQMWFNLNQNRAKIMIHHEARVFLFGSQNLTAPLITLPEYISFVLQLLVAFGLAFQLPLVVLALERIGIVDVAALKKWRRYVYFGMAVVSAFIIPDVVTGMLALMIPLICLYELGIFLAKWKKKPAD